MNSNNNNTGAPLRNLTNHGNVLANGGNAAAGAGAGCPPLAPGAATAKPLSASGGSFDLRANQPSPLAASGASGAPTGAAYAAFAAFVDRSDPAFQAAVIAATERLVYVPEYSEEIVAHFVDRERTATRNASYLPLAVGPAADVTEKMRCILVDWMVDVHIKFKLHPETFFLAVDILDRYLMSPTASATRATLQLVGVTATLIAAKMEEIWPPEVKDCIYISANTYTREEITEKERDVATALGFKLSVPTVYPFAAHVLAATRADEATRHTAMMFLEYAALDYGSLRALPSALAAAAVSLATVSVAAAVAAATLEPPTQWTWEALWPVELAAQLRCPPAAVFAAAVPLLAFATVQHQPNGRYQAIRRKYTHAKYAEVALLPMPTVSWLPPLDA